MQQRPNSHPQRSRWVALGALSFVLIGQLAADALDLIPGALTYSQPVTRAAPPLRATDPARKPLPAALPEVGLAGSQKPSSAALAAQLDPLLSSAALGSDTSMSVLDPTTGAVLFDRDSTAARTPASTMKILTGAAALSAIGGQTTFNTVVVQGRKPTEIILVGGGDMLLGKGLSDPKAVLGRAGLSTLAAQVKAKFGKLSTSPELTLSYDDSYLPTETANPLWPSNYLSQGLTGRVSALGLATDRAVPGKPSTADPSKTAALAFAKLLRKNFNVSDVVTKVSAAPQAKELARVSSAPLQDILGLTLTESDNALAELLARLTARAKNQPGTFEDGAQAITAEISKLGLDLSDSRIKDGSGLAAGSEISSKTLAQVLALAANPKYPQLRPVITGMPIAGLTGTLTERFTQHPAAAGYIRAKTGTLTGVGALAGITVDADGHPLVFAILANSVPATEPARKAMDALAATLAACGC